MMHEHTDALILAGGFGTRLRTLVKHVPKPMAPVHDRPFLWYVLTSLYQQGIRRTFISLYYLADVVMRYFGHYFYDMELYYLIEPYPLGTGGAILFFFREMNTKQDVFIINGDTHSSCSLQDMKKNHFRNVSKKNIISIALTFLEKSTRYHSVTVKNNRITSFFATENRKQWVNAGVYFASSTLKDALFHVGQEQFSLEQDFLAKYCKHYFFSAFHFTGSFIDIGIPEDYLLFQEKIALQFIDNNDSHTARSWL